MDLNPQKSLHDLESAYVGFMSAGPDQRGELAVTLQHAISRGEIEIGNLSRDVATNFEQRQLYKRLLCTVEMAKASMPAA